VRKMSAGRFPAIAASCAVYLLLVNCNEMRSIYLNVFSAINIIWSDWVSRKTGSDIYK